MTKSKSGRRLGPPSPVVPQPVTDGDTCIVTFGHNADIRRVLMEFPVVTNRLIFSPDDAENVATQLQYRAMLARGGKVPS